MAKEKEIVFPYPSEAFKKAWDLWKAYKKEQYRFTFRPIGEQAALNNLFEISNGSERDAIKIINQSITKGWRGLFAIKEEKNEKREKGLSDLDRLTGEIIRGSEDY